MRKTRQIIVQIEDDEVVLTNADIKFYLSETLRKKVHKNKIQKFFANLSNIFINKT